MEATFTHDRLLRLAELERWHFWFVPRRVLVQRLLRRYAADRGEPVLDVGCGTGLMIEDLSRQGHRVIGLDVRPEGLRATRRSLPASWLIQCDAGRLPLREGRVGVVLLLDVLEHVDEGSLLAEARRVLRHGGVLLATVPAVPWLWSYRDEAAGHLRRYTRRDLRGVLSATGLAVEEMRYYQCLLFPFLVVTRLLGRRRPGPRDMEERPRPLLNAVLSWINTLDARLGDVVPLPWGSSLVVVCTKR